MVVHTTDGTFQGTVAWFAQASSTVSAHYLIGLDGQVVQFVDEADTAAHAGHEPVPELAVLEGLSPNLTTIGIEFADGGDPHGVDRPDAQYRAGAELLQGISQRWEIPLDREHVVAHSRINPSKTCPGNLDLDRLVELAAGTGAPDAAAGGSSGSGRVGPRLVVLLPARNAVGELEGWFESVERFADAVVALDDGSTDATAAVLAAHPLVQVLVRNPRRESYVGWDDSLNRNRLLAAAGALSPQWVLSLDADERIPADDGAALREFVETDALPGLAYGMRCFRMWGGDCDPDPRWVYRLFAWAEGQRFPSGRLHFDPVPTSVPRDRHLRTSLRIQHWGSDDDERRAARIAKYREADPDRRYPTSFGGVDEVPADVVPWVPRVEGPVVLGRRPEPASTRSPDRAPSAADVDGTGGSSGSGRVGPRLVVLLPARNAVGELEGWFESVERFADAVVALDDGSTDATAAVLAAHPLVQVLVRNPRRESYVGWDDSLNRNRLLAAAGALSPQWVLSLDADERIPADDGAALREFVETDALPGLAYGMQCFRMVQDAEHYDRDALWVYRLFAWAEGQRVPDSRLHFVPVPTTIPRDRWLRTTIRIQHLASLDEQRRRSRFAKYREADPRIEYQGSYAHLLDEPGDVRRFPPRRPELGVVLALTERQGRRVDEGLAVPTDVPPDPDAPAVTAIVISRDDEDRIERAVGSVVAQELAEPFEVVVVTSGTDRTAEIVRRSFPGVRVIELDHPALPGEARNAGLRVARGDYVSFPGSHVELPPGSLAARVAAHDAGWTMVTGSTRNGTFTRSGWAAYFLDHSTVLPGRPSEQLGAPPAHCSYDRRALLGVGGFPEDLRAGEDTWVNDQLFRGGATAFRAAGLPLVHHNRSRTPWELARRHFARGRAQTQFLRGREPGPEDEERVRRYFSGYRSRRLSRIDTNVDRWGEGLREEYRRARWLVRLGIAAAWLGGRVEQRRPTLSASDPPPGGGPPSGPMPLLAPLRLRTEASAPWSGARPILLHLPKAAGSTLLRILEREIAPAEVLRVYDDGVSLDALRSLGARAGVAAVAGHVGFGVDRYLPGRNVYLTMLRDPVDRVVSHYRYVRANPQLSVHDEALRGVRSIEDYVTSSPLAELFNNGQTRLLGGDVLAPGLPADERTLERALLVVRRADVLVGVQERFDESLLLFRRAMGWGYPAYRRENVSPGTTELSQGLVELIRERNALDVALHRAAQRRVEADLSTAGDVTEELELQRLVGRWPVTG